MCGGAHQGHDERRRQRAAADRLEKPAHLWRQVRRLASGANETERPSGRPKAAHRRAGRCHALAQRAKHGHEHTQRDAGVDREADHATHSRCEKSCILRARQSGRERAWMGVYGQTARLVHALRGALDGVAPPARHVGLDQRKSPSQQPMRLRKSEDGVQQHVGHGDTGKRPKLLCNTRSQRRRAVRAKRRLQDVVKAGVPAGGRANRQDVGKQTANAGPQRPVEDGFATRQAFRRSLTKFLYAACAR